ncbi:MAG: hypothetical protein K0V04_08430 [Deltaproteobacteria bacterium]|nr:hypothetical protein [Deltaproteobacteria bacterium]
MRLPLVTTKVILEAKARLEAQLRDHRSEHEIHPETDAQVYATAPLDSHVPAWFAVHGLTAGQRQPEPAEGSTVHEYDAQQQLIRTIEPIGTRGDQQRRWSVFRLPDDPDLYHRVDKVRRGRARRARFGRCWEIGGGVWCDLSIDGHGQALAHCWQEVEGEVTRVDVWDTGWPLPESFDIERDAQGQPAARRLEAPSTTATSEATPAALADAILEQAEAAVGDDAESVFALTLVFEETSLDHLPPQIGVVYERNVQAYRAAPAGFDDDLGFVWNPLQAEDAEFPVSAPYPYVELREPGAAALGLVSTTPPEDAARVVDLARSLAGTLNAALDHRDWFFMVIEVSSYDWGKHADLVPAWARRKLRSLGLLGS